MHAETHVFPEPLSNTKVVSDNPGKNLMQWITFALENLGEFQLKLKTKAIF